MSAVLKKTEPSRSLFDPSKATQLKYTHSTETDLRAAWAEFFKAARSAETAESVQESAIAEHQAMNIRSFKR